MGKLLLLLLLVGCGPMVNANPEIYKHVSLYERLTGRMVTTMITFDNLPPNFSEEVKAPTLAVCKQYRSAIDTTVRHIIIDLKRWNTLYEVQREILILHELGHCEGQLGHYPNTIMNSTIINYEEYVINREEYLNEFVQLHGM